MAAFTQPIPATPRAPCSCWWPPAPWRPSQTQQQPARRPHTHEHAHANVFPLVSTQVNDNGPNAALKGDYNTQLEAHQSRYPGVPYTPPFFNLTLSRAWIKFSLRAGSIITRETKSVHMHILGSLLEHTMLYVGPFFRGLIYSFNKEIGPYFVPWAWP